MDFFLPHDCVAHILGFHNSVKLMKSLMLTNSNFHDAIIERPYCCCNITFTQSSDTKPREPKPYVFSLRIASEEFFVDARYVKNFPNLERLELENVGRWRDYHLAMVKEKLRKLVVMGRSLITNKGIMKMQNLQDLRLIRVECDEPEGSSALVGFWESSLGSVKKKKGFRISHDVFEYLPNLEKLEIDSMPEEGMRNFQNLSKKVKKMWISNMKLTCDIFKDLDQLEELSLNNCGSIRKYGFKYLKNLYYLDIKFCGWLRNKEAIKKSFEREDVPTIDLVKRVFKTMGRMAF